jgi:hypothetical protein
MTVNTPVAEAPVGHTLANKHLISDALWNRLVGRIVKDKSMDRSLAERIMDQALAFLALCAADRKGGYSPSPLVDIGWHTFILYTRAYAAFGEKMGGFIHHEPSDVEGVDYGTGQIARTVAALKSHGIAVDEPLWVNTGHDCCGGIDCSSPKVTANAHHDCDSGGSYGSCAGGACTT